jgi:hypothetical protein
MHSQIGNHTRLKNLGSSQSVLFTNCYTCDELTKDKYKVLVENLITREHFADRCTRKNTTAVATTTTTTTTAASTPGSRSLPEKLTVPQLLQ